MRITKIETQKKRGGRVSIFVDGEFAVGLSKETLVRAGLRVGDQLTPTRLEALQGEETHFQARNAALRLLSVRARSERELRDRLRTKEFGDGDIGRVIDDLKRSGLVNDDEFARAYIRNALTLRPAGQIHLRQKLLLLGVARETADTALTEIFAGVDVEAMAAAIARKTLARVRARPKGNDALALKRHVVAALARRGYAWPVIASVLKTLDLTTPEDAHDL